MPDSSHTYYHLPQHKECYVWTIQGQTKSILTPVEVHCTSLFKLLQCFPSHQIGWAVQIKLQHLHQHLHQLLLMKEFGIKLWRTLVHVSCNIIDRVLHCVNAVSIHLFLNIFFVHTPFGITQYSLISLMYIYVYSTYIWHHRTFSFQTLLVIFCVHLFL